MTTPGFISSSRAALVALVVAGCSGTATPHQNDPATEATATADAVAEVPPSVTASSGSVATPSPADAAAQKALAVCRSEGVDAVQAGRMAAFELSEDIHELPKPLRVGFRSITSEGVDPSQKGLLAGFICAEPDFAPTLEKLCGKKYAALATDLKKVPPAQRAAKLTELCKLTVTPSKDSLPKLDARGLLATNLAADSLTARGASASELELASLVPHTFPLDPEGDWR